MHPFLIFVVEVGITDRLRSYPL